VTKTNALLNSMSVQEIFKYVN